MAIVSVERRPDEGGFELWRVVVGDGETLPSVGGADGGASGVRGDGAAETGGAGVAPVVDEALEHEGVEPLFIPKVIFADAEAHAFDLRVFPMPRADIASSEPYPLGRVPAPKVSEKDVDAAVHELVASHGKLATLVGRQTPRMGDTVVIDVSARAAGGKVDDLTKSNIRFLVGSNDLPGKVTTLLLSMRLRETKRTTLAQGWRVRGELGDGGRSRSCEVRVLLKDILHVKAPELTDAWVAENMPHAGSVRGLRDIVRKTLQDGAREKQHDELLDRAAAQLTGRVTTAPPADAVAEMARSSYEGLGEQVHGGGYTITEYLNSQNVDEPTLMKMLDRQASSELCRMMALDALARDNHLEPGEADYAQAARTAGKAGIERPREALESSFGRVYAAQLARRARANEWLLERQGLGR